MAFGLRNLVRGVSSGFDSALSGVKGGLNGAGSAIGSAWGEVSGAHAQRDATKQMLAGAQQGADALNAGTQQAQGMWSPFTKSAGQNFDNYQSMVQGGAFDPKFSPYQAPAPYQSKSYTDPGNFSWTSAPDQKYGNTESLKDFGLQGQSFAMPNAPTRQAATTENLNLYADPGYQFRLNEGIRGLDMSAAAKGHLDSSGQQRAVMGLAQDLASQEFQNRYNRFNNDQLNARSDYKDDRDFNADQLNQAYDRFSGNRNFDRQGYQDERNFGADQFQQNRLFGRGNYENDRNFDRGAYQDDRNFGRDLFTTDRAYANLDSVNRYNRYNDLMGYGYKGLENSSDLAYKNGVNMADLYSGMANTRAAGTLGQSAANRALLGDLFNGGVRLAGLVGR